MLVNLVGTLSVFARAMAVVHSGTAIVRTLGFPLPLPSARATAPPPSASNPITAPIGAAGERHLSQALWLPGAWSESVGRVSCRGISVDGSAASGRNAVPGARAVTLPSDSR